MCQLVLPGICHAAGLHRSGSLDHIPDSPLVLPSSNAVNVLPPPSLTSDEGIPSDFDDEGTAWEGKEIPFCEDPSRNILAVNLIRYVGHWITGTMGTTILIPLQRLVDYAEETILESAADLNRKAAKHAKLQAEARDKAKAQMHSELDRIQPPGIPHHYPIFELAQLERQRRIELIRAGLSAATTGVHDPTWMPRNPKRLQPSRWLKHALVFNQETHGRPCDYRRSVVSGSRFVSSIEAREGKGLFQLIEFNLTWVNALEGRLGRPARDVGVHHKAVEYGHPIHRPVERNWETEGLIVPMTFGEHVAVTDHPRDSDEDSVDGFPDIRFGFDDEEYIFPPPSSPVTPTPTPIPPTSPVESETGPRLEEIDSPEPSWCGWRVARCGEVKYAWKMIQPGRDIIALDVAIQEDSLIYTAVSVRLFLYEVLC